jgi:hypothetical protein
MDLSTQTPHFDYCKSFKSFNGGDASARHRHSMPAFYASAPPRASIVDHPAGSLLRAC